MKKLGILFILFIALIFTKQNYLKAEIEEDCGGYYYVDPDDSGAAPGHLDWGTDPFECDGPGTDCEFVPCEEEIQAKLHHLNPYGHSMTLHLKNSIMTVKDTNGTWNTVTRSGNNFTFSDRHYIRITTCSAHPYLVGLKIPLNNLQTDNNGNYTIYVP